MVDEPPPDCDPYYRHHIRPDEFVGYKNEEGTFILRKFVQEEYKHASSFGSLLAYHHFGWE